MLSVRPELQQPWDFESRCRVYLPEIQAVLEPVQKSLQSSVLGLGDQQIPLKLHHGAFHHSLSYSRIWKPAESRCGLQFQIE